MRKKKKIRAIARTPWRNHLQHQLAQVLSVANSLSLSPSRSRLFLSSSVAIRCSSSPLRLILCFRALLRTWLNFRLRTEHLSQPTTKHKQNKKTTTKKQNNNTQTNNKPNSQTNLHKKTRTKKKQQTQNKLNKLKKNTKAKNNKKQKQTN